MIIINNNNNINNSNIFSYDINNNINSNDENMDIEIKNNKNIKQLLLFPNENIINNEFNEELFNENKNKELFNIGFEISRIEKSPYVQNNKSKDKSNISINNISINNSIDKTYKPMTIRERNIKKINERRRTSKALSNIDNFNKLTIKNQSFEINKLNQLKSINNSINTDIKDTKNKTFYSISGNISNKRIFKDKNPNNIMNKTNIDNNTNNIGINNITNINCTSERRYDKYSKYYNNYYKKNTKILTYNNSNNNSMTNHKYQSYSFMDKSNKKILDSDNPKTYKDNNFHNSITKKKLGLFSYNDEKDIKRNLNNSINNMNNINNINNVSIS